LLLLDFRIKPDLLLFERRIKPDLLLFERRIKPELLLLDFKIKPDLLLLERRIKPDLLLFERRIKPELLLLDFKIKPELLLFERRIKPDLLLFEHRIKPDLLLFERRIKPVLLLFERRVMLPQASPVRATAATMGVACAATSAGCHVRLRLPCKRWMGVSNFCGGSTGECAGDVVKESKKTITSGRDLRVQRYINIWGFEGSTGVNVYKQHNHLEKIRSTKPIPVGDLQASALVIW